MRRVLFQFKFIFSFDCRIIIKRKQFKQVSDDYYNYGDLSAYVKCVNKIVQLQYKSYDRWIFFVIYHPIFSSPAASLVKRCRRFTQQTIYPIPRGYKSNIKVTRIGIKLAITSPSGLSSYLTKSATRNSRRNKWSPYTQWRVADNCILQK